MPISLINEGRLTFRLRSCRNFPLNIVVLFSIQCILHLHAHLLDFHRASGNNDRILFHLLLCHSTVQVDMNLMQVCLDGFWRGRMVCKILARISSRFSLMKTNKQMRLGSDITFFNLFRCFIFDFGRPIWREMIQSLRSRLQFLTRGCTLPQFALFIHQ